MENVVRKLCLALLCLSVLSGCAEKAIPPPEKPPAPTLRIGLIPEQNIFKQLLRYEPLADYLSRKTGTRITLKILPRYGNIIDNFQSEKLDGAFFGSFTYALAHRKLGVEVIARPMAQDNTSTYFGIIFARKDSGIRTIAHMRGKRFVFVDKATTAGYLLPLEYFHENGVDDYKRYFRETYFSGTHEASIMDVLEKRAHAGAAKNTVFERLAAGDKRIGDELVVLATSPHVPENGLALRKDLDASLANGLKSALLGMDADPDGQEVLRGFGAIRFIETGDEDYEPVYEYARKVGLDLATYDYIND